MKVTTITIDRASPPFAVVDATVNNKTTPTSDDIITDLSLVLLEIFQQLQAERAQVTENE